MNVNELEALCIETNEKPVFEKTQTHFNTYSKIFQDILNSLGERSNIKYSMKNFDEDEMYFFEQNTNNLLKFDPKCETIESFKIHSVEPQGYHSCICKIDKKRLFVYGGFTLKYLSSAFIHRSFFIFSKAMYSRNSVCLLSWTIIFK